MTVVDPGHEYLLDALDGDAVQRLVFVKREGAKYPGNVGSHSGTTLQEIIRALIERCRYVNNQTPCAETEAVTSLLVSALFLLEVRAARCHGRQLTASLEAIVSGDGKCPRCGHVGCTDHAERCPNCEGQKVYRCRGCGDHFVYTNKYSDCGHARCEGEESDEVPCPACGNRSQGRRK